MPVNRRRIPHVFWHAEDSCEQVEPWLRHYTNVLATLIIPASLLLHHGQTSQYHWMTASIN